MRLVWIAIVVAALAAGGVVVYSNIPPTPYDAKFNASVAAPAYSMAAPIVLFDEGHRNCHTTSRGYKPFADLVRNDGYSVQTIQDPITSDRLATASVLVIVCPRGSNDANDADAFTDAEGAAIEQWVRSGGSLLLITDHWPFGAASERLALRFGVNMSKGLVEDPRNSEPTLGSSHLVFSRDNGLLGEHEITRGRHAGEHLRRVVTFTGQSIWGPPDAQAFLKLSDSAADSPPTPAKVEKEGGDVRVFMEYGAPVSARGRAQGLALGAGQGRVVVLGEAGMLSAQVDQGGRPVGMNLPGCDNRQLTLNIMHWLSRLQRPNS